MCTVTREIPAISIQCLWVNFRDYISAKECCHFTSGRKVKEGKEFDRAE